MKNLSKKEKNILILTAVYFTVVVFSFAISGEIFSYSLLCFEYGAERVAAENLTIVKAKPDMIISNGDKIGDGTTGGFYLLIFLNTICLSFVFFKLINWLTQGWLYKVAKEEGVFDEVRENKIDIEKGIYRLFTTGSFDEKTEY